VAARSLHPILEINPKSSGCRDQSLTMEIQRVHSKRIGSEGDIPLIKVIRSHELRLKLVRNHNSIFGM
jgi:hypothetical protein